MDDCIALPLPWHLNDSGPDPINPTSAEIVAGVNHSLNVLVVKHVSPQVVPFLIADLPFQFELAAIPRFF
jgi:hypothetical protein